jgi:hypothetical protein
MLVHEAASRLVVSIDSFLRFLEFKNLRGSYEYAPANSRTPSKNETDLAYHIAMGSLTVGVIIFSNS